MPKSAMRDREVGPLSGDGVSYEQEHSLNVARSRTRWRRVLRLVWVSPRRVTRQKNVRNPPTALEEVPQYFEGQRRTNY